MLDINVVAIMRPCLLSQVSFITAQLGVNELKCNLAI